MCYRNQGTRIPGDELKPQAALLFSMTLDGKKSAFCILELLVPKKECRSRAECFQSIKVVLQPPHSCSITSFRSECKSSNGSQRPGVHLTILSRSISPIPEVLEFTEVSHLNSIFRTDMPAEVRSLHPTASPRIVGPTASDCCHNHTER